MMLGASLLTTVKIIRFDLVHAVMRARYGTHASAVSPATGFHALFESPPDSYQVQAYPTPYLELLPSSAEEYVSGRPILADREWQEAAVWRREPGISQP